MPALGSNPILQPRPFPSCPEKLALTTDTPLLDLLPQHGLEQPFSCPGLCSPQLPDRLNLPAELPELSDTSFPPLPLQSPAGARERNKQMKLLTDGGTPTARPAQEPPLKRTAL